MFKSKKNGNTQSYLNIMNQWLILKQEGIELEDFLIKHQWKEIAIYGMGVYGRHLIREFEKSTKVHLVCGIDKKKMNPYHEIEIKKIDNVDKNIDVVINTIFYDNSVKEMLQEKIKCDVISLEDLIFESYSL